MKKILFRSLALALGLLISCLVPGAVHAEETAEQTETAAEETASDILVVFFSRLGEQYKVGIIEKGNTAIVAEKIAEKTGADTFEILPEVDYYPYTYDELTDIARKEQSEAARPAYLKEEMPDLSAYTTVFIGAPVWWGDWPMILYTFFEENAETLAGKTLYPFSTHEGSGLSGFDKKLEKVIPDSTVGEGLAVEGLICQEDPEQVDSLVAEWLEKLDF